MIVYFAKDENLCFWKPRQYKWLWGAKRKNAKIVQEQLGEEWQPIKKAAAIERFGQGAVDYLRREILTKNVFQG